MDIDTTLRPSVLSAPRGSALLQPPSASMASARSSLGSIDAPNVMSDILGDNLPIEHYDEQYLGAQGVAQTIDVIDAQSMNVQRLNHAAQISALLAGFAMVALVQINIDEGLPSVIVAVFALLVAILISVHMFSLLTSVCLLPNLEAYNELYEHKARGGPVGDAFRSLSPHRRFKRHIMMTWFFATSLGIALFLGVLVSVAWARFYMRSVWAAVCVTIIVLPLIVLFLVFSRHFHNHVIRMQLAINESALHQGRRRNPPRGLITQSGNLAVNSPRP